MEDSGLSVFQTPKLNFGTPSTWEGSPILDRKVWGEHVQSSEDENSSLKSSEKVIRRRQIKNE